MTKIDPPLEIPDRARDALIGASSEQLGLTRAARIIVATELRRLNGKDECNCHRCIRVRADELDPEGA